MRASRGMGAISPSKMPKGKKTPRRDSTDFTQFKKGGMPPDAILKADTKKQRVPPYRR